MIDRPRVLLIAEACNPSWVSVPLVGWSCSRALSEVAQTHLVTHTRNRPALLEAGMREGPDFTAIDSDRVAGPLHWLATRLRGGAGRGWTTVTAFRSLANYYFEHLVWKRFEKELRGGRFDVVHRITPLTPTAPSLLAGRCASVGVPFMLGPLNGGLPWPREFSRARRREGEWLSWLRGMHRCLPGYRATRERAAAILVGSMATWEQMNIRHRRKCIYIPENGIDPARFTAGPAAPHRRPLRVTFVGRLVDYKNPDVVIEALAPLARAGGVELDVFGDGPLRETLSGLIQRLAPGAAVRLRGWRTHDQLAAEMSRMDVLAFPSVREFGGGVVLEAMALGVVPIVVDYGGPTELISSACGIRIPLVDRDGLVAGLRCAVAGLARDPIRLMSMRRAGIDRVQHWFTWPVKAMQILEVYRWVLGQRMTKPDFGMPFADLPEEEATREPAGDDEPCVPSLRAVR
jgi:glycosyltransferase involved in cell wall biosynthesis